MTRLYCAQCCSALGTTNVSEWSSSLQYTGVTGLENGSISYVITNQVKVDAFGSPKLLPVTYVLPV